MNSTKRQKDGTLKDELPRMVGAQYATGSSVQWIFQVRVLEWGAIAFSSEPHFARTLHHDSPILGGPVWHDS